VDFLHKIFWFVIMLGVMIVVHELGHFWAALSVGIKVETFSLGFGPRLFGFRRGDTDFRVSAILFGGYVRMLGEQPGDERALDARSFQAKARWQQAIVIVAGPLMNVILAIALVTGLYMYAYPKEPASASRAPVVAAVIPNSAAAKAGVQVGDKIVQFGSKRDPDWEYVQTQEVFNANHALPVVVERAGQMVNLSVTPAMDSKEGVGSIGWVAEQDAWVAAVVAGSPAASAGLRAGDVFVNEKGQTMPTGSVQQVILRSQGKPVELTVRREGAIQKVGVTPAATNETAMPWRIGVRFGGPPIEYVKLGLQPALAQSLRFNRQNALMIFKFLGGLIQHRVSPKSLAGPIGIAQMSSQAAEEGPWTYLLFMAFVSLQLAIINLLPIPILDGGTLLVLIIEMLLQREVSLQVKETALKLGFVLLMMLMVFVIYNDISRIFTRG
jgi:regulator of sigma E protease